MRKKIVLYAVCIACFPWQMTHGQSDFNDMDPGRYGQEEDTSGGVSERALEFPRYDMSMGPGPSDDIVGGLANPQGPPMPRYEELPQQPPAAATPNPAAAPAGQGRGADETGGKNSPPSRELLNSGLSEDERQRLVRIYEEEAQKTAVMSDDLDRNFLQELPLISGREERDQRLREYFQRKRALLSSGTMNGGTVQKE